MHRMLSAPARLATLPAVLFALAVAGTDAARAVDDFDFKLFRPMVSMSYIAMPKAEFRNVEGEFGWASGTLGANIPLGRTQVHPEGRVLGHQVFLAAVAGTASQSIDIVNREPRLYNGAVSVAVVWAGSGGNLYYGGAGASFAEDEETIGDLDSRLYAAGLGSYRKSSKTTFLYGGALTYVFARRLFLPFFGVVWTPNETWSMSGALPFNWRVTQKFNESLRLSYLLTVTGQRYGFANEATFTGQPESVYERVRQNLLGAELEWRPHSNFALLTQAGLVGGRKIEFTNRDEEVIEFTSPDGQTINGGDDVLGTVYAKLTMRFFFGSSLLEDARLEKIRQGAPVPDGP